MKKKYSAFTLAEVLITLGIIGVVAAMTIPTLVNNYKEKELITKTKKTYTSIAQALELAQAYYETPGDNVSLFSSDKNSEQITKELAKYFNGAKFCQAGADTKGCKDLNYKIKYASILESNGSNNAAITSMTGYPRIVLNYGAVIGVSTRQSNCADYTTSGTIMNSDGSIKRNPDGTIASWTQTRNNCGVLVFDVNGSQRPNQFGRDAFEVNVFRDRIGAGYWGAMGTSTLTNILTNKKDPFVYSDYSESDEFEW